MNWLEELLKSNAENEFAIADANKKLDSIERVLNEIGKMVKSLAEDNERLAKENEALKKELGNKSGGDWCGTCGVTLDRFSEKVYLRTYKAPNPFCSKACASRWSKEFTTDGGWSY